jgi:thiaminase/transcriptional activator TenA
MWWTWVPSVELDELDARMRVERLPGYGAAHLLDAFDDAPSIAPWRRLRRPMVAAESFSAVLRRGADPIWEAQHRHRFVRGIADGTLAVEPFERFVRQDYVYLVDYARLMALGVARAPDVKTMRRFAELTQAILGQEMELHRAFAREFGITEAQLAAEQPAPLTRAYTNFLLRTAALGDFGELAAALLPCMWGYAEIGQRLAAGPQPADERYRRWIQTYAAPEFDELAGWCRDLVDRLAAETGDAGRERMRRAFLACSRHELAFWDVGFTG